MSDQERATDATVVDSAYETSPARDEFLLAASWLPRQIGRLIYTHNPFYVASAWMVFSGLRASFDVSSGSIDVWLLTLCLLGYTLLLSVTALLVVRLGKVWEDARSLLLLVVLMFLGISVTFDGILAATPEQAWMYYVLGWLFAATISETLLWSLPLRMGGLFRLPFHLLLAQLFLYPLVLKPRLTTPHDPMLQWELFGFSTIAAIFFLCLLPAVRRGPTYVDNHGSPWRWPWYPWVLFGTLGFCVVLRAYYLCVSLHFVGFSHSIFAPYFLAPLGLAAAALLLEAGLVSGSQRVLRWALVMPLLPAAMAALGRHGDPIYQGFVTQFENTLGGTPLIVTLWIIVAFYALAAIRGVAQAHYGVIISLFILSMIPASGALTKIDPLPLAVAGGWQIATAWRFRLSSAVVEGLCLLLASATLVGQGTWFNQFHGALPVHLLLVVLLGGGYWCHGQTGRNARWAAISLALVLASIASMASTSWLNEIPDWARTVYCFAMAALLAGYGRMTGEVFSYVGAATAAALGCIDYSGRIYALLFERLAGLKQLVYGALLFLLAAIISLLKAGVRPKWWRGKAR